MPAQLLRLDGRARAEHQVGDEERIAGAHLAGEHRALPDRGMAPEGGADLARLDAHAADLHLVVEAAEDLQAAVEPVAAAVAGEVEEVVGVVPEGVDAEAQPVLGGVVEIAEAAEGGADHDLADLADPAGRSPARTSACVCGIGEPTGWTLAAVGSGTR